LKCDESTSTLNSQKANEDAKPMAYSKGQTWGALKKAWRGYKVAKVQGNREDMKKYAERIRTLQKELGLVQAKFPELGMN
jgi:hypothetical protein